MWQRLAGWLGFGRPSGRKPGKRRTRVGRRSSSRDRTEEAESSVLRPILLAVFLFLLALLLPYSPGGPARADDRFYFDPSAIQLANIPPGLDEGVLASIQRALSSLAPRDLRDAAAIESLGSELRTACGWIDRVVEVRRRFPNEVELSLDLREPAALVPSTHGSLYFVDAVSRVLGTLAEAPSLQDRLHVPVLDAPGHETGRSPGMVLEDPVLLDGVAIALQIRPFQRDLAAREIRIDRIDLTPLIRAENLRQTDVELVTGRDVRIEWGRVPSDRRSRLDPSPEVRIRNVLRVASRYPQLMGLRRIRAQFERAEDVTVIETDLWDGAEVFEAWGGH